MFTVTYWQHSSLSNSPRRRAMFDSILAHQLSERICCAILCLLLDASRKVTRAERAASHKNTIRRPIPAAQLLLFRAADPACTRSLEAHLVTALRLFHSCLCSAALVLAGGFVPAWSLFSLCGSRRGPVSVIGGRRAARRGCHNARTRSEVIRGTSRDEQDSGGGLSACCRAARVIDRNGVE